MTFGGYRVPHPLEPAIQVKVQTQSDNPGPVQAVHTAIDSLVAELDTFADQFKKALKDKPSDQGGFEPMQLS